MAKDYTIQGTTKLQREKYANDALALTVLDAPEPSSEALELMKEYVDGKRELSDAIQVIINRYHVK
jgi:hypothetical protein